MNHDRQPIELSALVCRQLGAITFVQDYIQLVFDGPYINAITLPTVVADGHTFRSKDDGYRDALCERITAIVVSATAVEKEYLRVQLSDRSFIEISLRVADKVVTESAIYEDLRSQVFYVW